MKNFDTPLFNILFTIVLLIGLYFAYQWVFDEFDRMNRESFVAASSDRPTIGISNSHPIHSQFNGSSYESISRQQRPRIVGNAPLTRPQVTGLPPTPDAFAVQTQLSTGGRTAATPAANWNLTGVNASVTVNETGSYPGPDFTSAGMPGTREQEVYANQAGSQSGAPAALSVGNQRIGSSAGEIRPKGALQISQNNVAMEPFSSDGDNKASARIDPGLDPTSTEVAIPVGDGLEILLLLAVGYAIWKLKK